MPKMYGTPGPRMIYPDACTSRSLGACDPGAQLLFDRLITQCDDQGRMEADAAVVKALCMPLIPRATIRAVDRWLQELEAEGMIQRYSGNGRPLIQITNWWDFQGGMRRSYPSRWPAPDGWEGDRIRGIDSPPDAPERPPQGASAQPPRAVAEPSQAQPNQSPTEPDAAGNLPSEEDAATIACRHLPDGGRWLSDREYVEAWDDLEVRFKDWVVPEITVAYADLHKLGRVKAWDLKKRVELRLAERVRVEERATEKRIQAASQKRAEDEQHRIDEATPEEKERAAYQRRAISLGVRLGLAVPTDPAEVRAFVEKYDEGAAA